MLTCMSNLLSATEERVYFKDKESRFLFVSSGWLAAYAPGRTAAELVGKTDFDVFSSEHASAAFADEQRIIATGHPISAKVEEETFSDRPSAWVSTTKMPLREESGQIIGTFGISRDITAQIQAERTLAYQALHDPLTGLANRIALMDRLAQALVAIERRRSTLAVLFLDLDNFKQINDTFGHDAGDLVLTEIGRRLTSIARQSDTIARLGGRTQPWSGISPTSLTVDGGQMVQELLIAAEPPDLPGGQVRLGFLQLLLPLRAVYPGVFLGDDAGEPTAISGQHRGDMAVSGHVHQFG